MVADAMSSNSKPVSLALSVLPLLSLAQGAEAFDAADAVALIIGLILAFIMICAFLGWYSRRV